MIAFSFGFIAQQVGAEPHALRKLSIWGTDWKVWGPMPANVWEDSQCVGGTAHFIGSVWTGEECEWRCRSTPNAKACQYEDTWEEYYNCYAFIGDDVKNCDGLLVDWNDEDMEAPCDNHSHLGYGCMIFKTSDVTPARPASTCTGKDFKQKMQDFKIPSPGIKVFGCGKKKIKSECTLGCKRGYKLKNGSGEDKKKKGTKSTYVAKCMDGVVVVDSPLMSEEFGTPNPMIPVCQK